MVYSMPVVHWGSDLTLSCSILLWPQLTMLIHRRSKRRKLGGGEEEGRGKGDAEAQKELNLVTYMHTMVTKLQLHQLSYRGPYLKAYDPPV